jgi:anti-sigma factor RsiW
MTQAANEGPSTALCVTDAELLDYAEGRLPRSARRKVEGLLACNPDLAAQVMARMHLAGGGGAARRRPGRRTVAALAAVSAFLGGGLGWAAAEREDLDGWRALGGGLPPEYVEEAAESRQAVLIRATMSSQIETQRLDAREIERTLRFSLPQMPAAWRIRDVQVFPTDDGPAVALVVDAGGRRLDLFAVRAGSLTTGARPALAERGRDVVAYWERGDAAYVLSGPQSRKELLSQAAKLARADIL